MDYKKCPKCNSDVEDVNRFCGKCGHEFSEIKKRHKYLTAWLVILIITSLFSMIFYLFDIIASHVNIFSPIVPLYLQSILFVRQLVGVNYYFAPLWVLIVLAITSVLNIICLIALFKWKKWGYYGYLIIRGVVFFINLIVVLHYSHLILRANMSGVLHQVIIELGGVVALYAVLQIGNENKGWIQMRHKEDGKVTILD